MATCTQIRKRTQTGRSYSKKYKDTFELDKEYTIFVNPKFPSQFIIQGHEDDIDTLAIGGTIVGASLTILYTVIYIGYRKVVIKKTETN